MLSYTAFSQNDTLQSMAERIAHYPTTKYEQIPKGRMLLLDQVRAGKWDEVKKIVGYFDAEYAKEDYKPLWASEALLIYLYLQEYQKAMEFILKLDSITSRQTYTYQSYEALPTYNRGMMLCDILLDSTKANYDALVSNIMQQELTSEQKDFLTLLLKDIALNSAERPLQDEINKQGDGFVAQYPQSPFNKIVKDEIIFRLKMSDFSWGMYIGGGYTIANGVYTDYFQPKGCMTVSWDFFYKKIALYLSYNNGFGRQHKIYQLTPMKYGEKAKVAASAHLT